MMPFQTELKSLRDSTILEFAERLFALKLTGKITKSEGHILDRLIAETMRRKRAGVWSIPTPQKQSRGLRGSAPSEPEAKTSSTDMEDGCTK